MKKIYKYFTLTTILFAMSCNMDRDLDNPNEASTSQANVDLLMNKVQLDFAAFYSLVSGNDISGVTGTNVGVNQVVRMMAMISGSTYERALISQNFDQMWTRAYQDVLINIETLLPMAKEGDFVVHSGSAKVLKAYIYITLVDVFGDVPKTEALQGTTGVFNPKADPGNQIYAEAIALLDEAQTDLAASGHGLDRDIYYGGDKHKWITLANSLKLKAWMNISADPARKAEATTAISALLKEGNLIDTDAEEFTYKYGTADIPARSRHPQYRQFYTPAEGNGTGYIGNYFLKEAYNGKGIEDPRWRYYFFRQVGSIDKALSIDGESVPCVLNIKPAHYGDGPFCVFEPGFFGRDHGDASGTPPDGTVKTVVGVYPAGGLVDTNPSYITNPEDDLPTDGKGAEFTLPVVQGMGGNGKGIEPIYMAFFTDFIKAEAALRLGIVADEVDAKTHMDNGIRKSINRVQALGASLSQTVPESMVTSTQAYIVAVDNIFDASADQLDVVMKEYYLALFGNGIEAYNLYRRTSSPKNIQPMLAQNGGKFPMSLIYPAIYANLNGSVTQKTDGSVKVFWDKNTDDLK